jgi:hypothetical protein
MEWQSVEVGTVKRPRMRDRAPGGIFEPRDLVSYAFAPFRVCLCAHVIARPLHSRA